MTAETQDSSSSEHKTQIWDAQQYETALAHLERLQEQIDGLRSTISSLVTPLSRPQTSKAQLFATVRKSAVQSTDDLKAFRESWTAEQMQELFDRSRASLEKDGDLSKAREVARYG